MYKHARVVAGLLKLYHIWLYTPIVEDAVAHTMQQRSELDWLIYNDPLAYVGLVMSGKSEEYLKAVTR